MPTTLMILRTLREAQVPVEKAIKNLSNPESQKAARAAADKLLAADMRLAGERYKAQSSVTLNNADDAFTQSQKTLELMSANAKAGVLSPQFIQNYDSAVSAADNAENRSRQLMQSIDKLIHGTNDLTAKLVQQAEAGQLPPETTNRILTVLTDTRKETQKISQERTDLERSTHSIAATAQSLNSEITLAHRNDMGARRPQQPAPEQRETPGTGGRH